MQKLNFFKPNLKFNLKKTVNTYYKKKNVLSFW